MYRHLVTKLGMEDVSKNDFGWLLAIESKSALPAISSSAVYKRKSFLIVRNTIEFAVSVTFANHQPTVIIPEACKGCKLPAHRPTHKRC